MIETGDPRGITLAYTYDGWGNRVSAAATDTVTGGALSSEAFTYDAHGNLLSATNPGADLTATYDPSGRLDRVHLGGTLQSDHDYTAGRLTKVTDAPGATSFSYDGFGRLSAVTDPITGAPTTYSYDPATRLQARTEPSGLTHRYSYDDAARLTSESLEDASGVELGSIASTYDPDSRVTSRTRDLPGDPASGTHSFSYDPSGRLTAYTEPTGPATTYAYDGAGNRISLSRDPEPGSGDDGLTVTTTYDAASRPLSSSDGTTYTSDAAGNLTGVSSDASETTFAFDPFARLSKTSLTVAGAATITTTYDTDALGRTLTETAAAKAPAGPAVTLSTGAFTYRGLTEALTKEATDAAGITTTTSFGLGAADEALAAETEVAGEPATTSLLGLGPHHDLDYTTSEEGAPSGTAAYDPWGMPTSDSAVAGSLGFQADPTDTTTGLVDMGARHYLPSLGRFLTQDPIEGDLTSPITLNPYVYAGDDPVSNWDPTGLVRQHSGGVDGFCKRCPEPDPPPTETTSTSDYLKGSRCEMYCWFADHPSAAEVLGYQVTRAGLSLECAPHCQHLSGWTVLRFAAEWVVVGKVVKVASFGVRVLIRGAGSLSRGARSLWRAKFGTAPQSLPRSGPVPRSLGAASRAEQLAKKLHLNVNSPTTRQVLNSLDDNVTDFVGSYRKGSIWRELPGEVAEMSVEEALQYSPTVRKLLIDNRFIK